MEPVRKLLEKPKSKFFEVECKKCNETKFVFSKAATIIYCDKCGEEIAVPSGGNIILRGKIKKSHG